MTHDRDTLSALDLHLARTLGRLGNEPREEIARAIALLSHHVNAGNVCIDLADPDLLEPLDPSRTQPLWPALLASSPLVSDGGDGATPLVLSGNRLYLRRHWEDECTLAADLRTRARSTATLDTERFRATLDLLHSHLSAAAPTTNEPDWQRVAAFAALRRRLCVITGGPGTGKTTTVVMIAALAIDQAQARSERPPRIALCAPTGKAAGRLTEAVREAARHLPCSAYVRRAIPEEAQTIHRLLGGSATHPGRFRHNAHSPLSLDLLIVDEASMVDLALMTRLVAALPPTAGLILLGDRHQLASVQAGAVLADLCAGDGRAARATDDASGSMPGYSPDYAAEVRAATNVDVPTPRAPTSSPIRDCIVTLTRTHRFGTESDIGLLAAAIRDGQADDVEALLAASAHPAVTRIGPLPASTSSLALSPALRDTIVAGYRSYLGAATPTARLAALAAFRILCAHHQGPNGVHVMNPAAERVLMDAGLLRVDGPFYDGRPVLVTRNDYRVGLFNGDVGTIVHGDDDHPGRLAFFLAANSAERWLSPGRLPPCETAFAVSIHKSQGSELDRVLIMLPTRTSPVLSRELLYTAVSRARVGVTICASLDIIREAVRTPVRRASGLQDRLQDHPPNRLKA